MTDTPSKQKCPTCSGKGEVWKRTGNIPMSDPDVFATKTCPDCNGTGMSTPSKQPQSYDAEVDKILDDFGTESIYAYNGDGYKNILSGRIMEVE